MPPKPGGDTAADEAPPPGRGRYDRNRAACTVCGGPLGPGRFVYCSRACGRRAGLDAQRRKLDQKRAAKSCLICGGSLPLRHHRYCSLPCRKRAETLAARRNYDQERAAKSCGSCGGPLPYHHRKYCSPECWKRGAAAERAAAIEQSRPVRPCRVCGRPVPRGDGRHVFCTPECSRLGRAAAAKANQAERWAAHRKYAHGPGVDEWKAEAYAAQNGRCYVCTEPMTLAEARIDHDHRHCPPGRSCEVCRRGLAHHLCNVGIGNLGDTPERLATAARNLAPVYALITRRLADLGELPEGTRAAAG